MRFVFLVGVFLFFSSRVAPEGTRLEMSSTGTASGGRGAALLIMRSVSQVLRNSSEHSPRLWSCGESSRTPANHRRGGLVIFKCYSHDNQSRPILPPARTTTTVGGSSIAIISRSNIGCALVRSRTVSKVSVLSRSAHHQQKSASVALRLLFRFCATPLDGVRLETETRPECVLRRRSSVTNVDATSSAKTLRTTLRGVSEGSTV